MKIETDLEMIGDLRDDFCVVELRIEEERKRRGIRAPAHRSIPTSGALGQWSKWP